MTGCVGLRDIAVHRLWLTRDDFDYLINALCTGDYKLPADCIGLWPSFASPGDSHRFTPGSTLHFIFSSYPVHSARCIDPSQLQFVIMSYDSVYTGLMAFLDMWADDLPVKSDGRIDVAKFTSLELWRLLLMILNGRPRNGRTKNTLPCP